VPDQPSQRVEKVRAAELAAALSLATDLGMGFPFEHGLHATLMTMRLAELLQVDRDTAWETFYASLLMYAGCTTDAEVASGIFGSDRTEYMTPWQFGSSSESLAGVIRALPPPGLPAHRRAYEVARRLPMARSFRKNHFASLCEVAAMLAERLGLPEPVHHLFFDLTERWDGKGVLDRARADVIPLPLRIVHVARDACFQRLVGGDDYSVGVIEKRGGHAFDPAITEVFTARAGEVFEAADSPESVWEATLALEPRPWLDLEGDSVDRALAAFGEFADLVSPWLAGHSIGLADLAAAAAERLGMDELEISIVRRAALVHDVGRVAVHPNIWNKPGRLSADDWEQVRLHGYHTERVLSRGPFLTTLAQASCSHHERLDGSGYHRAVAAAALPPAARLLAAADAFQAMTQPRPHRAALSSDEAARTLVEEAGRGCQDPQAVAAVLEAAGQPAPVVDRPAGLTEREAEVIALLARGLQTKQVASALEISIKTADRHIQNAYRKIGVSTRAGATIFAMEHGLVWGELPIPRTGGGS
jgi:HD-GYP domain-containing protein (c-di-GMP phosphodiesterase class II)